MGAQVGGVGGDGAQNSARAAAGKRVRVSCERLVALMPESHRGHPTGWLPGSWSASGSM
ncbi:hypothetical protein SCATT_p01330 (plasmid) [Streptantibioticus cattleyicolor NRRL 8057 = DSM 46488]|uniref:Uncharacterized protein n=1 Tax=Streptantibioticus cattleyicolor (strain ATCC 35852 / DSM 46488 / JCM 4925 / NBRC 14057 / NRRL 8057) TaxID=1003195 RepID=F8JLG0_STREN|nr:hypothetical protein SCATT_p01330 [Streptantibioticus cattleyicolor NRRL 8057 = DSM 46488]CCB72616.1 protein of unknown function [Streptantibioticus cattleyicolor NRRL 8057 = DSM 46488]